MNQVKSNENLDKISDCIIDADGVYKYVQATCTDTKTTDFKQIVRGYAKYEYHAEIYRDFVDEVEKLGLKNQVKCQVNGGGRINIDKQGKNISIYGYSVSYGRCDHQVSVEIVKKSYPDYNITWSNEGY